MLCVSNDCSGLYHTRLIMHDIFIQAHKSPLAKPFMITPHLAILLKVIKDNGGLALLVGGCVRDHLLGLVGKDIDIEVYGLSALDLEHLLTKHFQVIAVGKNFGILKVVITIDDESMTFDVSLPRQENKAGQGHKGFLITTDPLMPFIKASSRRDFSINAMAIDPEAQVIIDAHQGLNDLANYRLRHVSTAFREDPLRVLRAAQFAARFALKLDEDTLKLARSLKDELNTLSKERIFQEMKKLMLAKHPSIGIKVLQESYALATLFPEINNLIDCPQDQEWHPEGDVFIHTLMVIDEAAKIITESTINEEEKLIVMLASLCHDLGKPLTTITKDNRIKSPSHEQAGEKPTKSLLENMGVPKKYHDTIIALVKEHLKPCQLYRSRDEINDAAIKRLALRCDIKLLLLVAKADFLGRTTKDALSGVDPSCIWLKAKLDLIYQDKTSLKPILQGRHLIALGQHPGDHFGPILQQAFQAQIDGLFTNEKEGLAWLKHRLNIT